MNEDIHVCFSDCATSPLLHTNLNRGGEGTQKIRCTSSLQRYICTCKVIYVLIINFHSDFFCDFLYIMDPLRYWFNPPLNLLCNQTVTLGFISPIYLYFKLFFNCKSFVGSLIIEARIHKLKTIFCLKECGICMS